MTKFVLICSIHAKSSQNRTAALAETGPRVVLQSSVRLIANETLHLDLHSVYQSP